MGLRSSKGPRDREEEKQELDVGFKLHPGHSEPGTGSSPQLH